MRVLITGGSGKIGQKLINCLAHQDLMIRVLVRRGDSVLSNQVEIFPGDLLNLASLPEAVKDIEAIVHLAALTHSHIQRLYWWVNVQGTENLIKAAQKAGVNRFILVSTRAIHPKGGAYSQSKLAAEEIVKNSGLNWIILRPAEVYGMAQGEMIDRLIKFVKKSYLVPIIKTDDYPLAPIYIDDLVGALERVVLETNLTNKIYTLTGPESFSFEELVEQICQFFRLKRLKIYCPLRLLKLVFKIFSLMPGQSLLVSDQLSRLCSPKSADISLARKDLAFNPISFQKGLSLLDRKFRNDKKDSFRN